ncbi:hypothetical protein B0G71_8181 [Paraburkholderia sp. BL27I4N3]|uniref:hypothetical protein n=1 Tax=Paraburkholderia sp. BL27I4N3 TaxID=1938805 RepID=UPI000E36548D|nr:hypothetical protein [Paraburkholderia sp. BL27I4N3]REE06505.1 hypothetical protein B0G71_8181 [Paraburkholderia sp. BL27I4N3]
MCLNFLNIALNPDSPLPHEEVLRLSEILHEASPDVLAIFSPSIVFENCGHYAPPRNRRDRHRVRYCDACAQRGYHSYLHELSWVSRCPFHMCELKDAWVGVHADSVAAGHMAALNVVMQERCRSWPHCDNSFPSAEDGYLSLLGDWVTRASLAAESRSGREIWRSEDDGFPGDLSLAQAFGQLRALVPMPEAIESLFAEAGDTWGMETCQFPQQTRIKLEQFQSRGLGFARIFDFYKCIGAFSAAWPSFVTRARHAQDSLRERHGICRCEWELTVEGWHPNWVKVHAEERNHWSFRCRFDVAIAELDLCWARQDPGQIRRNPTQNLLRFVGLAQEMHAAGLVRYSKGSKLSTKGYLYTDQQIASCCEWFTIQCSRTYSKRRPTGKSRRHTALFRGGWITLIMGFSQGNEMTQNIAPACAKPTMVCCSFGGSKTRRAGGLLQAFRHEPAGPENRITAWRPTKMPRRELLTAAQRFELLALPDDERAATPRRS